MVGMSILMWILIQRKKCKCSAYRAYLHQWTYTFEACKQRTYSLKIFHSIKVLKNKPQGIKSSEIHYEMRIIKRQVDNRANICNHK